jgi:hypothetical protein
MDTVDLGELGTNNQNFYRQPTISNQQQGMAAVTDDY